MTQEELLRVDPADKLQLLSKEELIEYLQLEQKFRISLQNQVSELRSTNEELRQKTLLVDERLVTLKNRIFGKSSEKKPTARDRKNYRKGKKKKIQLPSQRYPDAPLIEREVEFETPPDCSCCGSQLKDSGMTENSEFLTVVPAQYMVVRQKRHKYRCEKCHGNLQTAPAPPRIQPGSSYSDEMAVDVAMSKYCDLIPIERYASIAGRGGLEDLPPQSLIQLTHDLADFVRGAYEGVRKEVLDAAVIHADETPHRMLEDHGDKPWYLWGFSTPRSSYFEIHDTRSGDVSSEFLKNSRAEYLVSDVFSGYSKTTRVVNELRKQANAPPILNVYCNAHARRKFKLAEEKYPDEVTPIVELYEKIYRLERIAQERPKDRPDRQLRVRRLMRPLFEKIRRRALTGMGGYSSQSLIVKAWKYFLKNEAELTRFLDHAHLPIDNNPQERQMRSPVVGRKTWYGTHSKRGAQTAAIHFSLVESCKLNGLNPRDYFKQLVRDLHQGKKPYTPLQCKSL